MKLHAHCFCVVLALVDVLAQTVATPKATGKKVQALLRKEHIRPLRKEHIQSHRFEISRKEATPKAHHHDHRTDSEDQAVTLSELYDMIDGDEDNIDDQASDYQDDEGVTESACEDFRKKLAAPTEQMCSGPFMKENQSDAESTPHRIAFVLRGECFRRNVAQYDRNMTVDEHSKTCQLNASKSHVRYLIKPLEKCGVAVDIFIISWKPEGQRAKEGMEMMGKFYRGAGRDKEVPREVNVEWLNRTQLEGRFRYGGEYDNYQRALRTVARTNQTYDAMLLVRADLVFKRPLVNLPNVEWQKLMFIFHEWERGGGYPAEHIEQRVPDTIFWFPWKFLNCAYTLGWKEHFSAAIHDFVGFENMAYMMPNDYHDANTAADRNPIYRISCRQEQALDIHGGHAFAMFNMMEIKVAEEAQKVGNEFSSAFFWQGDPLTSPPSTMVLHSWSSREDVKEALHTYFGQIPQDEAHEDPDEADLQSSWRLALHSLKRSFDLLKDNQELTYKAHFHPRYTYDRIAFVRLEHHFPSTHISLYAYDTTGAVFVMFGSDSYPSVPTCILMSHQTAWKFGDDLASELDSWSTSKLPLIGFIPWLAEVTGLPVKEIPTTSR